MSARNDGGPAFPTTVHPDSNDGVDGLMTGMSLRDWFAGQVLANMSGINPNLPGSPASGTFYPDAEELASRQAKWAYLLADAMLAERSPSQIEEGA